MPGEGLLNFARDRTELPQRIILQHQRDAKGGEDRRQRVAPQQRAQGRQIDDRAEQRDHQGGDHQSQPKIAGRRQCDHTDIGAEHEELAMGKVDDVHNAEDQGQPGGDQRQDHAGDDAVDRLDQQLVQRDAREELHATRPNTDG